MRVSHPAVLVLLVTAEFAYCQSGTNITVMAQPGTENEDQSALRTGSNSDSEEAQTEASVIESASLVSGGSEDGTKKNSENSDSEASQGSSEEKSENSALGLSQDGDQEKSEDSASGGPQDGTLEKIQSETQDKSQDVASGESQSGVQEETGNEDQGKKREKASEELGDEAKRASQEDDPENIDEGKSQAGSSEGMEGRATDLSKSAVLEEPENESDRVIQQQTFGGSKTFWTWICHAVSQTERPNLRTQYYSQPGYQRPWNGEAQRNLQTETQGRQIYTPQTQQQICGRCAVQKICRGRQVNQGVSRGFQRRIIGQCQICSRGKQSKKGESNNEAQQAGISDPTDAS